MKKILDLVKDIEKAGGKEGMPIPENFYPVTYECGNCSRIVHIGVEKGKPALKNVLCNNCENPMILLK